MRARVFALPDRVLPAATRDLARKHSLPFDVSGRDRQDRAVIWRWRPQNKIASNLLATAWRGTCRFWSRDTGYPLAMAEVDADFWQRLANWCGRDSKNA